MRKWICAITGLFTRSFDKETKRWKIAEIIEQCDGKFSSPRVNNFQNVRFISFDTSAGNLHAVSLIGDDATAAQRRSLRRQAPKRVCISINCSEIELRTRLTQQFSQLIECWSSDLNFMHHRRPGSAYTRDGSQTARELRLWFTESNFAVEKAIKSDPNAVLHRPINIAAVLVSFLQMTFVINATHARKCTTSSSQLVCCHSFARSRGKFQFLHISRARQVEDGD